ELENFVSAAGVAIAVAAHAAADLELHGLRAGSLHALDVDADFLLGGGIASGPGEVNGNLLAQDAAHQFADGLVGGLAEEVDEALLDVGHAAPEGLAGEFVVGDVD